MNLPVKPLIVPDYSPFVLATRANSAMGAHDLPLALEIIETVMEMQPRLMAAHNELGNIKKTMGFHDDAIRAYVQALELAPQSAEIYMNIGSTLIDVGELELAADYLVTAITLMPDLYLAKWNLAITMLTRGDLHNGWRLAWERWLTKEFIMQAPKYNLPYWNGEKDARVLVWGEQGMGERIMYAPMIKDLVKYGCVVFADCDARFEGLFQRAFPEIRYVSKAKVDPGVLTHQISMGDLGPWFRDSFDAFPKDFDGRPGYLKPQRALAAALKTQLHAGGKKVIGLCWKSGNPAFGAHKSMSILDLAPIIEMEDVICVNLQYGDTADELANAAALDGLQIVTPAGIDLKSNMEGVAALMTSCDMVVSVSNTHAHLAAALGVPTRVMLPARNARFWYWFMDREDSPWYPTAKVVRQSRHGRWGDVVEKIAQEIRELPDPAK